MMSGNMRNGIRGAGQMARDEYRSNVGESTHRDRAYVEPQQWTPELRIVRQADLTALDKDEWRDFLDDVGEANYRVGTAKAYGSLAMVHVTNQEASGMIGEKYARSHLSPSQTVEIQRKIASGVTAHVREGARASLDSGTARSQSAYSAVLGEVSFSFSNDLAENDVDLTPEPLTTEEAAVLNHRVATEVLPILDLPTAYNDGQFPVKKVQRFGHGYALDLSGCAELYEEHQGILTHLKRAEGLNTGHMFKNWVPHVSVFKPMTSRANRGLPYMIEHRITPPDTIDLSAPRPITSS